MKRIFPLKIDDDLKKILIEISNKLELTIAEMIRQLIYDNLEKLKNDAWQHELLKKYHSRAIPPQNNSGNRGDT